MGPGRHALSLLVTAAGGVFLGVALVPRPAPPTRGGPVAGEAREAGGAPVARRPEVPDRAGLAPPATPAARRAEALRREILEPVFLLAGDQAVGSAVLVARLPLADGRFRYRALTAWHVVRDILAERPPGSDPGTEDLEAVVERRGRELHLAARLEARDPGRDLALLHLDTAEDLRPLAHLAPAERARDIRVFTPLYAVGCPLGTAPQATRGELTREHWRLEGRDWWMVSTPAWFGNSGGGVFLADTRELVGIYARIYTQGGYRPQVIPHMGLAVRLEDIHAWLEDLGVALD